MLNFYLFCFCIGVLYVLASLFLGDLFHTELPFFSPTALFSFLLSFGGSGAYFEHEYGWGTFQVLSFSTMIGVATFLVVLLFVALPLKRGEKSNAFSSKETIAKTAEVTVSIPEGGTGEIVYQQGGFRLNGSAKNEEGLSIKQGEQVQIVKVDEGIFYVTK